MYWGWGMPLGPIRLPVPAPECQTRGLAVDSWFSPSLLLPFLPFHELTWHKHLFFRRVDLALDQAGEWWEVCHKQIFFSYAPSILHDQALFKFHI